MNKFWRLLDHTADLGVEVWGSSLDELFSRGAQTMFELMIELDAVENITSRRLVVDGEDLADLWINFLREALYVWNGENVLIKEVQINRLTDNHLEASLSGEPYDPRRHDLMMEIKAVTYHQAEVVRTTMGWTGRVIFDV